MGTKRKDGKKSRAPGKCSITDETGSCKKPLFVRGDPKKGTKDACMMHYQRHRRTGSYGGVGPEISTDGDGKAPMKVYVSPDLRRRIERLAKAEGQKASEWSRDVLEKKVEEMDGRARVRATA